jgi:hypothetical protein
LDRDFYKDEMQRRQRYGKEQEVQEALGRFEWRAGRAVMMGREADCGIGREPTDGVTRA